MFGLLVLALPYPFLKQMAPDAQAQSFLFSVLVVAVISLSLISIASKELGGFIV